MKIVIQIHIHRYVTLGHKYMYMYCAHNILLSTLKRILRYIDLRYIHIFIHVYVLETEDHIPSVT